MIQFAISKVLNVRSAFPHKDIHKERWYSADSEPNRSRFTDITALRGPDIGSDNNSLKINFKVKLRVKTGNKHNEERKMVNVFQNPKWKQEYAIEINNNFEILENLDDEDSIHNNMKEKWENIKTTTKETKQQFIEKDESTETFKNNWYDEEHKFAIQEMKKEKSC